MNWFWNLKLIVLLTTILLSASSSWAQASIAQHRFLHVGASGVSHPSPVSLSFGNPVATGTYLLASVFVNQPTLSILPPTDSLGNAYAPVRTPCVRSGQPNANGQLAHFLARSVASGTNTVTLSWTGGNSGWTNLVIAELLGLDSASPVASTACTNDVGNVLDAGPVNAESAGQLVYGFGQSWDVVTGADDAILLYGGPDAAGGFAAYRLSASSGPQRISATDANAANGWNSSTLLLRAAESVPTPLPTPPPLPQVAHRFTLTWTASATGNPTGYNVYRATTAGASGEHVGTTAETRLVDVPPSPGTQYCYTVTAFNAFGESVHSNEACAVFPGDVPAAPTNLSIAVE